MEQKTLLPLDLQLFADEPEGGTGTPESQPNGKAVDVDNPKDNPESDKEKEPVNPEKVIEKLQKRIGLMSNN